MALDLSEVCFREDHGDCMIGSCICHCHEDPHVGEDQVVPIWGFEDLFPMARQMLEILNEHRPGELSALKGELHRFLNGGGTDWSVRECGCPSMFKRHTWYCRDRGR